VNMHFFWRGITARPHQGPESPIEPSTTLADFIHAAVRCKSIFCSAGIAAAVVER
jgi:hypothetical protein